MENEIMESILFTAAGGLVLAAVELNLVQIPEILTLILGFIAFAALLHGIFGLYNALTSKDDSEDDNI
jgi:hypothetical protein